MTVAELIERLKRLPLDLQAAPVVVESRSAVVDLTKVDTDVFEIGGPTYVVLVADGDEL